MSLTTITSGVKLIPASQMSLDELTAIYNQTRVDYIVPMPMTKARLEEYIHTYDVNLTHSLVATDQNGALLGVAMLGIREKRAWITRLGVVPTSRRHGAGEALMTGLLENSTRLEIPLVMLEVIKNNLSAYQLFLKLGFRENNELLILRRPPTGNSPMPATMEWKRLDRIESLDLVCQEGGAQPWTNQCESFQNAEDVSGLRLTLSDRSSGWLVYQRRKFTLTRFACKAERGAPADVTYSLLLHLHHMHSNLDAQIENISKNDPCLPGFYKMGYIESFHRIEMWKR